MTQLQTDLQDVFRRAFGDDSIVIEPTTTAEQIDGWDSMAHINLIIAVEKKFGIKFAAAELAMLGRQGQNVGTLLGLIEAKTAGSAGRSQ